MTPPVLVSGDPPRLIARRRLIPSALIVVAVAMTFAWWVGQLAGDRVRRELVLRAGAAASLHAAVLRSELEKHRLLPVVLAADVDVRRVLDRPTPEQAGALNRKLEELAAQTRAADIYLLDARGTALASSNWRLPSSFVGANYSFRPYFKEALERGAAEHFALGVSGQPGLFFAHLVVAPSGRLLGVVVVKVEFEALESDWRGTGDLAFVSDPNGVILITAVPGWRFNTLHHLSRGEQRRIAVSQQFGHTPLLPAPMAAIGDGMVGLRRAGRSIGYVAATAPAFIPGWTLHLLVRASPAIAAATNSARLAALSLAMLLAAVGAVLLVRRGQAAARRQAQQRAHAELEARVDERTRALRVANDRLLLEMDERRRAEASRQKMQDELVQSNKLALLGQIAAGVAHEINQPVAAIRTYADNAEVLLQRSDHLGARANLGTIATLTERIGTITGELRAFARRATGTIQPVVLEDAIGGALLLIGHRARQQDVPIVRSGMSAHCRVVAERVRLEQVLVNLLQNALEALDGESGAEIRIDVRAEADLIVVRVIDNGPGVDPSAAAELFTPFVTTKPSGLGLGLVISRDLAHEFGGELVLEEAPEPGAQFRVALQRVDHV